MNFAKRKEKEVQSLRSWLRNLRSKNNFTMLQIAKMSGISESHYSKMEKGDHLQKLLKI